nr:uncharacterized protein LOC129386750 [Dermacentor andersoni]
MRYSHRACPAKAVNDSSWNFAPGDHVYVRNYGVGDKWAPGTVETTSGARLLDVKTADGFVRRHLDQVRKRTTDETPAAVDRSRLPTTGSPVLKEPRTSETPEKIPEAQPQELRRSTRSKKPVVRFGY